MHQAIRSQSLWFALDGMSQGHLEHLQRVTLPLCKDWLIFQAKRLYSLSLFPTFILSFSQQFFNCNQITSEHCNWTYTEHNWTKLALVQVSQLPIAFCPSLGLGNVIKCNKALAKKEPNASLVDAWWYTDVVQSFLQSTASATTCICDFAFPVILIACFSCKANHSICMSVRVTGPSPVARREQREK